MVESAPRGNRGAFFYGEVKRMIRLVEKEPERRKLLELCEKTPFGCKISSVATSYGFDKSFACFWLDEETDVVFCLVDGVMLLSGTVLEGDALEGVGRLLKKGIGWALGGLLMLFTTYLTVSGAVAGAVDARAVKLAKTAIAGAVPVVGGILSEAAESVLAGAGILKASAGVVGMLAVLALCLTPFLRLGAQYLLYQGASMVAAAAGQRRLVRLMAMLGDAFGLVLAMTGASALLLLVSVVSSLTAVTP